MYITRPGVNARLKAKKRNPVVPLMPAVTNKTNKNEIKAVLLAAITDIMAKKSHKGAPAANASKEPPPCWRFKKGTCKFGDECRFSHAISKDAKAREAGSASGTCRLHGPGHSDAECKKQTKSKSASAGDPMRDLMAILETRVFVDIRQ